MLGRIDKVAIHEYELPANKGEWKLNLSQKRTVLAIIQKDGKNILLVQETVSNTVKESIFNIVETGETFPLNSTYIGTYTAGDKLLHLYGKIVAEPTGGALAAL